MLRLILTVICLAVSSGPFAAETRTNPVIDTRGKAFSANIVESVDARAASKLATGGSGKIKATAGGAEGATAGAWQSGFTMASGCSWEVSAMAPGPDGKLYLGGSPRVCGSVAGVLYAYDPVADEFSTLGDFTRESGRTPSIQDLAIAGDKLYVLGLFDHVDGLLVNKVAQYDFTTEVWSSLGSGDENGITDGLATEIAADAANVYVGFIGGENSRVGTLDVNAIARWDIGDQTWSAMNGGLDRPDQNDPPANIATVNDLLLDGGTLFAGGAFTSAGGASIENVASFDLASGWSAVGAGVDGTVNALATDGTSLFAAGGFTDPDSGEPVEIVEFDGTDWSPLAPALDTVGLFGGKNAQSLLVADGFLYLGGWFSNVDGVSVNNIARFDLTARTWSPLGTGADNGVRGSAASSTFRVAVNGIASLGGAIYAGGFLTVAGTEPINNIARWDPAGGNWSGIGSSSGNGINAQDVWGLATDGTEVLTAGPVTQAGLARTIWAGRFDIASGTWSIFGDASTRDFLSTTLDVAFAGGEIFFNTFSGLVDSIDSFGTFDSVNGIVRWDESLQDWSAMGPSGSVGLSNEGTGTRPQALAGGSDALYVSGTLDMAGETPVSNIARWDVAGQSWSALGSGLDAGADELLVAPSGEVYAAGPFSTAGGVPAEGIAVWDPAAGTWSALGAGISNADDSGIFAGDLVLLPDGDLVVAGTFDTAGAIAVNNIARWDGTQWHALGDGLTFESGDPVRVEGLAVSDTGEVFAGGDFDQSGAQPLDQLGRWDGSGWSAVGPTLAESEVQGDSIDDLVLVGPDLFVAGDFGRVGGVVAANFAHFVRDLGGSVLEIDVSAEETDTVSAESTQVADQPKSGVQNESTSVVYTIDIRNRGMNNANDVEFAASFSPSPVSVEWTCSPLPESRAACPQTAGTGIPDLLLDLPFESGLRFELVVEPVDGTVFQEISVEADAEQQFGDAESSRAIDTEIVAASDEGVFKSGFEP